MMITVVGGLGSIILGVAIIAIALKFVRTMKAHPGAADLGFLIWLYGCAAATLVMSAYNFAGSRKRRRSNAASRWRRSRPHSSGRTSAVPPAIDSVRSSTARLRRWGQVARGGLSSKSWRGCAANWRRRSKRRIGYWRRRSKPGICYLVTAR